MNISKIYYYFKKGKVFDLVRTIYYRNILPKAIKTSITYIGKHNEMNIPLFNFNLTSYADAVVKNKVVIWGKEIDLGNEINWSKDYYSNYVWPKDYYIKIKKIPNNGADVKFPWELSRFHQATWLAYAYSETKNMHYATKFVELVNNWLEENSYLKTVNYLCAMDVAIRSANLVYVFFIFKKAGMIFDECFENKFVDLIYKQGNYIWYNREYAPIRGNHYTSDLVGLFICGLFFRETNFGRNWLQFAKNELEEEIKLQTLESGVNFELSIPYHRLTTELFLYSYIFGKLNNVEFSENYKRILQKQIQFISDYTKPNNLAPLIGDNDSGHLFYFPCFDNRSHVFLLELSKQYLNFVPEINTGFIQYKDAGFIIYKKDKIYLFFKNSPLGLNGIGGHNHNDNLSFELNYNGQDIFIDPGTYVYTANSDLRNKFRSVEMHNTVFVDKQEQNDFSSGLFSLVSKSSPKLLKANLNEMSGELQYNKFSLDRVISCQHNKIVITDFLDNTIKVRFNLTICPNLALKVDNNLKFNEVIIKDNILYINKDVLKDAKYSQNYYDLEKTKSISFEFVKNSEFVVWLGDISEADDYKKR